MRKDEIKAYVDEMMSKPSTDATGLTPFEQTFTNEEWDFFMKVIEEKENQARKGLIEIPEPLVG